MYNCVSCGKEVHVELKTAKKIICPYCGYRILRKSRPTTAKKVMAE